MEVIKLMDGLVEAGSEPEYKWLYDFVENFTKAIETHLGKKKEAWSDEERDKCNRLCGQYLQEKMEEHFDEVSNA